MRLSAKLTAPTRWSLSVAVCATASASVHGSCGMLIDERTAVSHHYRSATFPQSHWVNRRQEQAADDSHEYAMTDTSSHGHTKAVLIVAKASSTTKLGAVSSSDRSLDRIPLAAAPPRGVPYPTSLGGVGAREIPTSIAARVGCGGFVRGGVSVIGDLGRTFANFRETF